MNVSRSRRTSGSAFSQIISDALVCVVNTWQSPVATRAARTASATRVGDLVGAAAARLELDLGLKH